MTTATSSHSSIRTIAQQRADERIVRATVTADKVVLTDEERCFFDSGHNRSIRALMSGNRAPFLS